MINYLICFSFFLQFYFIPEITNMSKTPITKYCPNDLAFLFKVFEKHPSMEIMSTCCATRIHHRFFITEKQCIKKNDPKYITIQSCKKENEYQAQTLHTPLFEKKNLPSGILLIKIVAIPEEINNNVIKIFNSFYSENSNSLNWEKKLCSIYGITNPVHKPQSKYYDNWSSSLNNTLVVRAECSENFNYYETNRCWLFLDQSKIQFCDEDIGCPMLCDEKLIGIASLRYNWKIWGLNSYCGNLDINSRYIFLDLSYVKWIRNIINA